MEQGLQVLGALLILAAFAAVQFGAMDTGSRLYLSLNAIGAAVLSVVAIREEQWGFVLLESVWTAVSLWGLLKSRRSPADA